MISERITPPVGRNERAWALPQRLCGMVERRSGMLAALMILAQFAVSLHVAAHRTPWFDELLTVWLARLPDWRSAVYLWAHGPDQTPPLSTLVVHFFEAVCGRSMLAARLPGALAVASGLVLLYAAARTVAGGLAGVLAVLVALNSSAIDQSFNARPYAFTFCLSAFVLWAWVQRRLSERQTCVVLASVLFAATSFHYYACLLLVPLAVELLLEWRAGNDPQFARLAWATGGALAALALHWPLTAGMHVFRHNFWSPPSVPRLLETYGEVFPQLVLLLAAGAIWIALTAGGAPGREETSPAPDRLGWLFLLIPLGGFVLAELVTGAFVSRYFVTLIPGLVFATALLLWRRFGFKQVTLLGLLVLLGGMAVKHQVTLLRRPNSYDTSAELAVIDGVAQVWERASAHGAIWLVLPEPAIYIAVRESSGWVDRWKLCAWSSATPEYSVRLADHMHELLQAAGRPPIAAWSADELCAHAGRAALVNPTRAAATALERCGQRLQWDLDSEIPLAYPAPARPDPTGAR